MNHPSAVSPYAIQQLISTRYPSGSAIPAGAVTRISTDGDQTAALTSAGWFSRQGERWTKAKSHPVGEPVMLQLPEGLGSAEVTSSVETRSGDIWFTTTHGAWKRHSDALTRLLPPSNHQDAAPQLNPQTQFRMLVADASGLVYVACSTGIAVTDGTGWWSPMGADDGMPITNLRCVALAPNGDIWAGGKTGAWRLRSGLYRYFAGGRWLPGDTVYDIAIAHNGDVWLATGGGVARIEERTITLESKADHYQKITDLRHNRRGFVTTCVLKSTGNPTGGFTHEASDNDGLWTAIYTAAQAYRYGCTRTAEARTAMHSSLSALLSLTHLSGVTGFPVRAEIAHDEPVVGFDPNETVTVDGYTSAKWFQSPVDPTRMLRGDTSSDELDGHYFAWYVCYTTAADDDEKRAIRDSVRAVTNNLLRHGFMLTGPTGRRTSWGVFDPQHLNNDPTWTEERGLNSGEMLCYLRVAMELCGDRQFEAAYEDLISNHHYLLNMLEYRRGAPWWLVNHSDDELAFLVYFPLLQLERRPDRRRILLQAVTTAWTGLKSEANPLYNIIYAVSTGQPFDRAASLETLERWPWELVDWTYDNSRRTDVELSTAPDRSGLRQVTRALPPDERRTPRWNQNPFEAKGGNPTSEEDGAAFALPYWMGRYYGLVPK